MSWMYIGLNYPRGSHTLNGWAALRLRGQRVSFDSGSKLLCQGRSDMCGSLKLDCHPTVTCTSQVILPSSPSLLLPLSLIPPTALQAYRDALALAPDRAVTRGNLAALLHLKVV